MYREITFMNSLIKLHMRDEREGILTNEGFPREKEKVANNDISIASVD